MTLLQVWPYTSAASRYVVDSQTNSCSAMPLEWLVPGQVQSPAADKRERTQQRMPPRSGIQAIIDRRPVGLDPWLDDEHD